MSTCLTVKPVNEAMSPGEYKGSLLPCGSFEDLPNIPTPSSKEQYLHLHPYGNANSSHPS